jgi:Zn-dependent protease with chaperone function
VQSPLVLVPIAIELTLVVTTIAPLTFKGRFSKFPSVGISLWLTSFLVAFVSTVIAIVVSVWSIFDTWQAMHNHVRPMWQTILFSFAPWIVLALGGISMALFVQKIEPVLELRQVDKPVNNLPSDFLLDFQGIEVRVIRVKVWFAFTEGSGKRSIIYVSSEVKQSLTEKEFEALLWHEYMHAKFHHNTVKAIVRLIRHLGGIVLASRILSLEIDRLCEQAADNFAIRRTSAEALSAARSNFA